MKGSRFDALCRSERALLGAAMLEEFDLMRVLASCAAGDFVEPRHRAIMNAIFRLVAEGKSVVYSAVADCLEAKGSSVSRAYLRECLWEAFHAVAAR